MGRLARRHAKPVVGAFPRKNFVIDGYRPVTFMGKIAKWAYDEGDLS
jgi:hypothetical protein